MINKAKNIDMMEFLNEIGPLERTLCNNDTDKALDILSKYLEGSNIMGYASGAKVWGWEVPQRWEVKSAKIIANGKTLVDYAWHPLHLLNYSVPFNGKVSKEELFKHLYFFENYKESIPFIFSFYEKTWGFSIPYNWLDRFVYDEYEVVVDTEFTDGKMNVLEYFLPGKSEKTIIFCNNICHPTQVNDSLTGVAASLDIFNKLKNTPNRKYSYLFLVVPETIGSIAYLSQNPEVVEKAIFGIVCEMLGTNGEFVGQKTRHGSTYLDHVLYDAIMHDANSGTGKVVDFLKSACNDEKVMDSPGVNIPTISITRYPYPEYHSSSDNFELISEPKLNDSRDLLLKIVENLEKDYIPILNDPGPIFLSGNGLYPDWRNKPELKQYWDDFINVMYAIDNKSSIIQCAFKNKIPLDSMFYWCDAFASKNLLQQKNFIVQENDKH